METRTLRYFLAIAREENMTAAARQLHVSQSALSRQMSDLEQSLGKKLFTRTNKQTLLTEDGMRLRQRAEEIIALIEKTEMELQTADDDINGEIHIGAGESRGFSIIAQAMRQAQEKYPHITFSVYSANALDVAERLEHGSLDFGLMFEPVSKDRYEYLDFPYADKVGLLVKRDSPLAACEYIDYSDLSDIPLLVSYRLSPDAILSRLDGNNAKPLNIRGTYNLINNASLMVEAGVGSALVIDGLIPTGDDSPFRFVPIRSAEPMKLTFLWKKYQMMTRAASAFLEELKKLI